MPPAHAPRSVAQATAAALAEMNPLVKVSAVSWAEAAPGAAADAAALPPAFLARFDALVLCNTPWAAAGAVNAACRAAGVRFLAGVVGAEDAALFCDLGPEHTYVPVVVRALASVAAASRC